MMFSDKIIISEVVRWKWADVPHIIRGGNYEAIQWSLLDGFTPPTAEEFDSIVDEYKQYLFESEKQNALSDIGEFATNARRQVVGFADEVKLAEYADKAALADRLVEGTATPDEIDSAVNDAWALLNGVADPVEIGKVWQARSNALRVARNKINLLEAQASQAIADVTEPDDIPKVLDGLKVQADKALQALLAAS